MTDAYWEAFFQLHQDLPREGPGEPADVVWAAGIAGLAPDARICDAACGPGADIADLLAAAPHGHVTAIDKTEAFIRQASALYSDTARVTLQTGDMADLEGPFDFIWCAGAVYFLGVGAALRCWRKALAPGGIIAFSQICWFTKTPSEAARAGWSDYAEMTDENGLYDQIEAAGYDLLASRRLSDKAWDSYYKPLDRRIDRLWPRASGALQDVLQEAKDEAALWRSEGHAFGYLLCVVRPT